MTNLVTYNAYRLQLMNLYRKLPISIKNYLKTETKQNNTKKRERKRETGRDSSVTYRKENAFAYKKKCLLNFQVSCRIDFRNLFET